MNHRWLECAAVRTLAPALLACGLALPASAQDRPAPHLEKPITPSLAIVDFPGAQELVPGLLETLRADLDRSGFFSTAQVVPNPSRLHEASAVDYRSWDSESVVLGSATALTDGRVEVRFRLYDVAKGRSLGGMGYRPSSTQARTAAHRMADWVYEKLSGTRGSFSTRIAYVLERGGRYELQIADADGAEAQTVIASPAPIASPSFSPDGGRLAYVSHERLAPRPRPTLFVHTLADRKRRAALDPVRHDMGEVSSMSASWAPHGATLAVMVTGSAGSRLYSVGSDGTGLKLIASSAHADANPAHARDGEWIYFTSNRSGSRQIHRIPSAGGPAHQVTHEAENYSPVISPDGKTLAYISRQGGAARVIAMDLGSARTSVLSHSPAHGRISFSPNAQHVVFDVAEAGLRALETASIRAGSGRRARLRTSAGAVGDPAWSPYTD